MNQTKLILIAGFGNLGASYCRCAGPFRNCGSSWSRNTGRASSTCARCSPRPAPSALLPRTDIDGPFADDNLKAFRGELERIPARRRRRCSKSTAPNGLAIYSISTSAIAAGRITSGAVRRNASPRPITTRPRSPPRTGSAINRLRPARGVAVPGHPAGRLHLVPGGTTRPLPAGPPSTSRWPRMKPASSPSSGSRPATPESKSGRSIIICSNWI